MASNMVKFVKMHSAGNDFMAIDLITQDCTLDPHRIKMWADRHTGIGFDQLITLGAPEIPEADFSYNAYNADGSQAEQCGNGAVCISMLAKHLRLTTQTALALQTVAGITHTLHKGRNQVQVDMGKPATEAELVPFNKEKGRAVSTGTFVLQGDGILHEVRPISMGNPHGVIFVQDLESPNIESVGKQLSSHPFFPNGANIGFCKIVNENLIELRVYERGVGETLACGTGACAAVVAGQSEEMLEKSVRVELPGGMLQVSRLNKNSTVELVGEANLIFEGLID